MPKQTEPAAFKEKFEMIRVTEDLKKRFENICKKNSQNQSEFTTALDPSLKAWFSPNRNCGSATPDYSANSLETVLFSGF